MYCLNFTSKLAPTKLIYLLERMELRAYGAAPVWDHELVIDYYSAGLLLSLFLWGSILAFDYYTDLEDPGPHNGEFYKDFLSKDSFSGSGSFGFLFRRLGYHRRSVY
jgi:hypothetical protein